MRKSLTLWIFLIGLAAFQPIFASPTPGTYELYDANGRKTGKITVQLSSATFMDQPSTRMFITTEIEYPGTTTYKFSEKERVDLMQDGVWYFERHTDYNGKLSVVQGERKNDALYITTDRDGMKLATAVPLANFDMTEYEMDLSSSPFNLIRYGQSKSLRVFFVDDLQVHSVSRNVSKPSKMPYNDQEVPVVATFTLLKGKTTTSWFHAETRELLQEEGPNHHLSRVEK